MFSRKQQLGMCPGIDAPLTSTLRLSEGKKMQIAVCNSETEPATDNGLSLSLSFTVFISVCFSVCLYVSVCVGGSHLIVKIGSQ